MKVWKKNTGEQLQPEHDWISPRFNVRFEIKHTIYSILNMQRNGSMRVNASISNRHHTGDMKTYIIFKSPDGWFITTAELILAAAYEKGITNIMVSDRPDIRFNPNCMKPFYFQTGEFRNDFKL